MSPSPQCGKWWSLVRGRRKDASHCDVTRVIYTFPNLNLNPLDHPPLNPHPKKNKILKNPAIQARCFLNFVLPQLTSAQLQQPYASRLRSHPSIHPPPSRIHPLQTQSPSPRPISPLATPFRPHPFRPHTHAIIWQDGLRPAPELPRSHWNCSARAVAP
jgi:hypothetical protein